MENRVSSAGFWRNLRMKPTTNAGYETEMQNVVQRTFRETVWRIGAYEAGTMERIALVARDFQKFRLQWALIAISAPISVLGISDSINRVMVAALGGDDTRLVTTQG